jgi:D-tyrosyl-tRNA(Tyr) deacylase
MSKRKNNMKAVIQRVTYGSVEIDGAIVSEIGSGMVILFGAGKNDNDSDAEYLAEKIANLRIFEDDEGKMNKSLIDVKGEALVVSQFTLYADAKKGRRPSFTDAANPNEADRLYKYFTELLSGYGITTSMGVFGADMLVNIKNDGPVTILLDTEVLMKN